MFFYDGMDMKDINIFNMLKKDHANFLTNFNTAIIETEKLNNIIMCL
jgi:hypothetical protein